MFRVHLSGWLVILKIVLYKYRRVWYYMTRLEITNQTAYKNPFK